MIKARRPDARDVLDVPAGNGIATYAFARAGFRVVAVEPDPSTSVGRGAIVTSLSAENLEARIVDAFGEKLPFDSASFDVVYVRQGLHHARDLKAMLREYARVLRPGGVLLGCREHVVDDYGASLREFLDSQVDHQLYGGENAFTLADYRAAFFDAHLSIVEEIGPYDSPINLHPNTPERLAAKISRVDPRQNPWCGPAKIFRVTTWDVAVEAIKSSRATVFVRRFGRIAVNRSDAPAFSSPLCQTSRTVPIRLLFLGAGRQALHGWDVRRLPAPAGERGGGRRGESCAARNGT